MGYTANSIDVDFVIPADKVPAALAALHASGFAGDNLADAVEEATDFHDCWEDDEDVTFHLGHHYDKFVSVTDEVLNVLAPFANEGSFVRLIGEDDALFGYRVLDGKLEEEAGTFTWTVWRGGHAVEGTEQS